MASWTWTGRTPKTLNCSPTNLPTLQTPKTAKVEEYDIAGKPDGSYEQLIKGNHGEFTLKVDVAGGKITNMEITNGRDTMYMGDAQLEAFFNEVITGQSVEVDAIAGATLDSNAMIDALKKMFVK